MVFKVLSNLRNWRNIKVNFNDVKFLSMIVAAMGAAVLDYYLHENNKLKPSPLIPAEKLMSGQAGPFAQRVNTVNAPLKGSFPLDHDHACKLEMLKYMICLKEHKSRNEECRENARIYFKCRMDNGLMDKDSWPRLGFKDESEQKSSREAVKP
ncbi:hypothetical protein FO519_001595 [Halicephalobus sp. NKZ332]|nr:hypothetical protein FO519_001595 [Halicephalobus sp. NKZ332]